MLRFEWDPKKDWLNRLKHGIDFATAAEAFFDERRFVVFDEEHSHKERRYFCIGKYQGRVMTVRFTHRGDKVRILGAGYWREGRAMYEKENS